MSEGTASSGAAGEGRVRLADLFDAEIRAHYERFRAAAAIVAGEQVLDIGCGTGESTRDAARAAAPGRVLGVDVSPGMLELARRRSAEDGLDNVEYVLADAQVHPFPPERFDVAISRFGTMFFADPAAAFTNVGRALRPGGRLVLLIWQARDRNEWATEVGAAIAGNATPPEEPASADPFSLGDPAVTEAILQGAGFAAVDFADVHEPVYYGRDRAEAYDLVTSLRSVSDTLARLDATERAQAEGRLWTLLAEYETGAGVFFDSRAWIVTATRR
jgi:SAM-dependent methyltransferase